MKNKILIVMGVLLIQNLALANEKGNGGDVACEDRFNVIRDDIASWINRGGSAALKLPASVTLAEYNRGMLKYISDPTDLPDHPFKATVQCTSDKVFVDGVEKACKNEISSTGAATITCNSARFAATEQSDQYVLVHHEYAGLAGFEENTGAESHYIISNQISGYLRTEEVKKLVVVSSQYTTAAGIVFNRVPISGGGQGWQAPDGTIWSDDQGIFVQDGGSYSSGGADANTIVNSPAAKACQKVGGLVPTKRQYDHLLSYFPGLASIAFAPYKPQELAALVAQSNQSYKDLTALFPQMARQSFWTSETYTMLARYNPEQYYNEESDSFPVIGGDFASTFQLNAGDGGDDSPSQANYGGNSVEARLAVQCVITPQ